MKRDAMSRHTPWRTADGRITCAAKMTDLHLLNVRRHVGLRERTHLMNHEYADRLAMAAWGRIFDNEIERRNLDNVSIDYEYDAVIGASESDTAATRSDSEGSDYLGRLRQY